MTTQEYFSKRLRIVGVTGVTEELLSDFLLTQGVEPESEQTEIEQFRKSDEIFLQLVLTLLLKPNVSEGDMTISYDKKGIADWYSIECARLGVKNLLINDADSEVSDMSFLA